VNCYFAQTFTIDSTHRHGGSIEILHVENSYNSKKLGQEKYFLSDFLENGAEFWGSVCTGLRRLGALWNGCKKLGDFLETFPSEGANFFYRVSLKVHWNFTVDLAGVPGRIAI